MSQYCRYCAFCTNGDAYYCSAFDKVLSASYIKRPNKCKFYGYTEQGDVDSGKPYKPKPRKKKTHEQAVWAELIENMRKEE